MSLDEPHTLTSTPPGVARRNRWRDAAATLPDTWVPHRTVAVVIPAYEAGSTLDLTLAALAAQDYPEELVEVVVVDDGSETPYELPEIRPRSTRRVVPASGWGRANACHSGVLATTGEIIVWLDADVVPTPDHLTQHLRWHDRLADVATKGELRFVDTWDVTPAEVRNLGAAGLEARLGADGFRRQWVEDVFRRTDDLDTDSPRIFSIFTGASGSLSRDLYLAAGGMDTDLRLGEDTELAYRLAARGAVFVPARDAVAWHLGPTTTEHRAKEVQHHDTPYYAQRAPLVGRRRTTGHRIWRVPLVHAVVSCTAADAALARRCVDMLLTSLTFDLHVTLVAPWDSLTDERRRVLDDPRRDLFLLEEWFRDEPRVTLASAAPDDIFPAPFRLDVPVTAGLGPTAVDDLLALAESKHAGLVRVPAPGGTVSLLRTAADGRARRNLRHGADPQSRIDAVWGLWWASLPDDVLTDLTELENLAAAVPAATERERARIARAAKAAPTSTKAPAKAPAAAAQRAQRSAKGTGATSLAPGFRAPIALVAAGFSGIGREVLRRVRRRR